MGVEAVCRHCLQILTAETIKIWKFCRIRSPILDQYVSQCGERLSDVLGAKPPGSAPPLAGLLLSNTNIAE